jgi:hypothetical protein
VCRPEEVFFQANGIAGFGGLDKIFSVILSELNNSMCL